MTSQACEKRRQRVRLVGALIALTGLIGSSCGSSGAESSVVDSQAGGEEQAEAVPTPEAEDQPAPTASPVATAGPESDVEAATTADGGEGAVADPPNDLLANAVVIDQTALPFVAEVDTTNATSDLDDEEVCPAPALEATVWYSITPTSDVRLSVSGEASDYAPGITALVGDPGSLEPLECRPFAFDVAARAGLTYYFQVFDAEANGGNLVFSVEEAAAPPDVEVASGFTPIRIDATTVFDDPNIDNSGTGAFDVAEGAEAFGCTSGSLVNTDLGFPNGIDKVLTCEEGSRTGTVTIRFIPVPGESWSLTEATGDFEGLVGRGVWDPAGETSETLSGEISFDVKFAVPVQTFPRLVSRSDNQCSEGFVTIDGLFEYATVDGELRRLDLLTQEITSHGPAPAECATWLGDEARGRRIAVSADIDRAWFGPFDGPFENEIVFETERFLLSRTFAANRLFFYEPELSRIVVVDATTGEDVGTPLVAGSENGRDFTSTAVSADETLLAVGGSNPGGDNGDGRVFLLDAESGDQLYNVDLPSPATSLVFDEETQELVAATFTGGLITIDLATRQIVNEVSNSSGATIGAIGIRADGLIVTQTDRAAELIDRMTGPTGASLLLGNSGAARIRPDGTINSLTNDGHFEIFVIEG